MADEFPTSHHLLPYERRAASAMLATQQAHPTAPGVIRSQQNYGPEGVILLAASFAGARYSFPIGLVGFIVALASGFNGIVAITGYSIMGVAIAVATLGAFRGIQAGRAGRRFRGDRPFIWKGLAR
jgi:hypothetical protein